MAQCSLRLVRAQCVVRSDRRALATVSDIWSSGGDEGVLVRPGIVACAEIQMSVTLIGILGHL